MERTETRLMTQSLCPYKLLSHMRQKFVAGGLWTQGTDARSGTLSPSEGERAVRGPSHSPNRRVMARSRPEACGARSALRSNKNMTNRLSRHSWGRVLLHLAVLMRGRRNLRWHLAGIRREL